MNQKKTVLANSTQSAGARKIKLLALAFAAATSLCATNITIINPDFELAGPSTPLTADVYSYNTTAQPYGWTVAQENLEFVRAGYDGFWTAESGNYAVDLNGRNAGNTIMSQILSGFTVGDSYKLTYYASENTVWCTPAAPCTLETSIGGANETLSLGEDKMTWAQENLDFTATSSTLTLAFEDLTNRGGNGGPAIDNVSISSISSSSTAPEPGTLWLCALLLLALGFRHRRGIRGSARVSAEFAHSRWRPTGRTQMAIEKSRSLRLVGRTLLVGLTPLLVHASLLTGNLLTNPGAETGNLTGWTAAGNTGAGVDNGSFDPGINPHTGSYDFYGGPGNGSPLGTLSQTVSIITGGVTTGLIDAGTLSADVSFWVQSLNQGAPSDEAYVQLTFLNASHGVIGQDETASVYSIGSWENVADEYLIPTGTRSITYTMGFQLEKGTNIDSFVDDNVLEISGGKTTAAPEPALSFLGLAFIALATAFRMTRKRAFLGSEWS
jgi:hypothetical protein